MLFRSIRVGVFYKYSSCPMQLLKIASSEIFCQKWPWREDSEAIRVLPPSGMAGSLLRRHVAHSAGWSGGRWWGQHDKTQNGAPCQGTSRHWVREETFRHLVWREETSLQLEWRKDTCRFVVFPPGPLLTIKFGGDQF